MSSPLRVLFCTESSHLATGFSLMSRELLGRLAKDDRFEVCEFAVYGDHNHRPPWAYCPVPPPPGDTEGQKIYDAHPLNQFGGFKFESIANHFRPTHVCSFGDPWAFGFALESPFRPYYRVLYEPTVDGEPQSHEWLAMYGQCDGLLTYTDWSMDLLKKEGKNNLPLRRTASPGVDTNVYRPPPSKARHREELGLDPNALILGYVSRNQARKLFPDLFEGFSLFLREGPEELTRRAYLYIHTAWPDWTGWDLPSLIREHGVGSRVLWTYRCKSCGAIYPSFWQDGRAVCRRCGQPNARTPASMDGIPQEALSRIYGLMDLYVQFSCSEGLGLGQLEAAACGVPVLSVDYSAMADVVRKLGGTPIAVQRFYRDISTNRKFALPCLEDFVQKLTSLLRLPTPVRENRGREARRAVERHFNWENFARVWAEELLSLPKIPDEVGWASPRKVRMPPQGIQEAVQGLPDEDFVRWGISQVAGRPDMLGSYHAARVARDLSWGKSLTGGVPGFFDMSAFGQRPTLTDFDREAAIKGWAEMAERANFWEAERCERNSQL